MNPVADFKPHELQAAYRSNAVQGVLKDHRLQIERDIRQLGAVSYDMWLPETHLLPLVIQPTERILGIVYGRYRQQVDGHELIGRGALVLTTHRLLLIDKKPFSIRCSQLPHDSVSSMIQGHTGFVSTVTLHTRMGKLFLRTFNAACAYSFTRAMEQVLAQMYGDQSMPDGMYKLGRG